MITNAIDFILRIFKLNKNVHVVVNFLSQVIVMFFFVSTSLAYITIPKKQRKHKNNLG